MLTVSLAADAGETITVYNALETLTFRSADNVTELHILGEDVPDCELVSELELSREVVLEFDELFHGSCSCLLEMPLKRRAGVLLCCFVIGKLHCRITVGLHGADLRNNARTSLDDGAWYVLTISTENGCHSDFLSN